MEVGARCSRSDGRSRATQRMASEVPGDAVLEVGEICFEFITLVSCAACRRKAERPQLWGGLKRAARATTELPRCSDGTLGCAGKARA